MILLILVSVFTITSESLPVINKREAEYYSNTVDIEKLVSVFTDIKIIEELDLSEDDNYYKIKLDEGLGQDNYKVIRNSDSSKEISVKTNEEYKEDYKDNHIMVFPLIDYKDRYYNVVVNTDYIIINELVKNGEFDESNKNYSNDNRIVHSINIER